MEPIFINQYTRTRKLYQECLPAVAIRQPGTIILIVIAALYFICGVLLLAFGSGSGYLGELLIVLALCMVAFIPYKTRRAIKLGYERDLETNQGQPKEIILVVTEEKTEGFISSKDIPAMTISFQDVKRVIETKNYYLLITKAKLLIVFSKAGFVKGTPETFLAFLRSRGLRC